VTFRIDRDQIRDNSDGSIDVPGQLTRTGVFPYKRGEDTVRELRSDAEVFSEESLDGLRNVLVTKDHPSEFLTTDNWREHSIGHVSHVASDPPYVTGRLRIYDKDAIHSVRGGYLTEVSCGYECVTEATDAEDADVTQMRIAYNHVAIGPDGWSRLGTQLRLDSNDNEVLEHFNEVNMEELEKALEPVLEAIKGLEGKYETLSATLDAKSEEAEQKEDSPIHKEDVLPDAEHIDELVRKQAEGLLSVELRTRDAAQEILGWRWDEKRSQHVRSETYRVDAVLCARKLCEDVLRTVDSDVTIEEGEDLTAYVNQAELLAKQARAARLSKLNTRDSIQKQLSGAPAHMLQTPKSRVRFPGSVRNEG